MNPTSEELRLIDLNFIESRREFARWADRARVVEESGVLVTETDNPVTATFLRVDPAVPAAQVARRLDEVLSAGGSLGINVRDHADADLEPMLRDRELRPGRTNRWMVLRKRLEDRPTSAGAELRVVDGEGGFADVVSINSEAYEIPRQVCKRMYGARRRIIGPHLFTAIAFVDGEAASTATALLSHNVAGVYWVGTRKRFRGRGLGEACTRAASNWAFDQGARVVGLQASAMGEPIYRRLGYEVVSAHRWYRAPEGVGRQETEDDACR